MTFCAYKVDIDPEAKVIRNKNKTFNKVTGTLLKQVRSYVWQCAMQLHTCTCAMLLHKQKCSTDSKSIGNTLFDFENL